MKHVLTGKVVHGKQLGRTIGFPTANIDVSGGADCTPGVYFGRCDAEGKAWRVIINIGTHPTVPEGPPTVEAHLIGYSGDLYGRFIEVELIRFMRSERKFASVQELKEQLTRDMQAACALPMDER